MSNPPFNDPSQAPLELNDFNDFWRKITNTTDYYGEPPFSSEEGEIVITYWYDPVTDHYYILRLRFIP